MKKSLVLASLLLVGSVASATDTEYFVSAGVGSGSMDMKVDITKDSDGATGGSSNSDSGAIVSIFGGVIIDDAHRIGLGYTTYNTSGDNSMSSIDIGYDYRFVVTKQFKPFVGVAYSINSYSENLTNTASVVYDNSSIDITTNILIARIGADYEFTENIYASASYDYGISTSGSGDIGMTISGTHYTGTLEFDKMNRYSVNLGYKF